MLDEAALRQALACGDVVSIQRFAKLIGNIVDHPAEVKFRKLNTDNKAIKELLAIPGFEKFVFSVGFNAEVPSSGVLVMPEPSPESLKALRRERERIKYELIALQSEPIVQPQAPTMATGIVPAAQGTHRRLVIFDFDGTITIDSHVADHGIAGERLHRLSLMADALLAADVCTVLVTAQRYVTTECHTVPLLIKSGLTRLFCTSDVAPDSHPKVAMEQMLYRRNPAHGAIYTGQEAWNKMPLIEKIIAGDNCWNLSFSPSNVLFVDDRSENFRGHEALGIVVHHVKQDGMNEDDVSVVEQFAASASQA